MVPNASLPVKLAERRMTKHGPFARVQHHRALKGSEEKGREVNWCTLAQSVEAGRQTTEDEALAILRSSDDELLDLLQAAFRLRSRWFGRRVDLHVIRNARSGGCTEDCAYCSQSGSATTAISSYSMQPLRQIAEGARAAKAAGAVRYCIVTSGRGPSGEEVDEICDAARTIRSEVDIQICTSLGLLTTDQARRLVEAGVNRYNHNLETSERYYSNICTTHTYADRERTIRTAKAAGLEVCCGGLLGMGETDTDRVALAMALRKLDVDSVPVNLLDPRKGTALENQPRLTPCEGLRALAMFRFTLPKKEIRIAGGREAVLRTLQPLALFPANSMFIEGYLTTPGQPADRDLQMLKDAGFEVGKIVAAD